jgi:hypothetical protein
MRNNLFFLETSPHPLSDLTPPSPNGRGGKYSKKRVIERGITEKNISPLLRSGEGAGG